MNSRSNSDAISQIMLRADIAAIIGRYVNLKGKGQTLTGICPFHKEKTPSFTVNPVKGVFYCFGCQKGGNVFNFVQEIEGVSFREALEMLAEETGVQLETGRGRDSRPYDRYDDGYYGGAPPSPGSTPPPSPNRPPARTSKLDLLAIHDEAAKYFYQCIKKHPQSIDYFKSRGLKPETVKEFCLGYAPPGWSGLLDYLAAKGIPQPKIIECGLAVSKEGGAVYDRFRNRIMFPLNDVNGRVIAFAGRGLDADTQPKYLNSPETQLYHKSRVLYGIHKARESVRDKGRLLILEGYMDYLTLYQEGIRNAAAVSGTAFTADHAQLAKRYTSRVTLVFDGDRAGLAAAQKAAFALAPSGLQVSILTLPDGDDPDSFVKREGGGAFEELAASAKTSGDFLIDKFVSEHDGSPHGKSRAADELMPYALDLADSIVRDDFLSKLAHRLRIDRRHIDERLAKSVNSRQQTAHRDGGMEGDYRLPDGNPSFPNHATPSTRITLGALEESFLRILFTRPDLVIHARQHISCEIFTDEASANIYSIILDAYAQKGSLDGLSGEGVGDPETGRLVTMLMVQPARAENIEDELVQKIVLLRRKHIKAQMAELRGDLKACPDSEKDRIMERLRDCGEQLKELDLRE